MQKERSVFEQTEFWAQMLTFLTQPVFDAFEKPWKPDSKLLKKYDDWLILVSEVRIKLETNSLQELSADIFERIKTQGEELLRLAALENPSINELQKTKAS